MARTASLHTVLRVERLAPLLGEELSSKASSSSKKDKSLRSSWVSNLTTQAPKTGLAAQVELLSLTRPTNLSLWLVVVEDLVPNRVATQLSATPALEPPERTPLATVPTGEEAEPTVKVVCAVVPLLALTLLGVALDFTEMDKSLPTIAMARLNRPSPLSTVALVVTSMGEMDSKTVAASAVVVLLPGAALEAVAATLAVAAIQTLAGLAVVVLSTLAPTQPLRSATLAEEK